MAVDKLLTSMPQNEVSRQLNVPQPRLGAVPIFQTCFPGLLSASQPWASLRNRVAVDFIRDKFV